MHVALDANANPTPTSTTATPQLFRHCKREDWGMAVLLWEREGKRGYRFEGGDERTFKEGYYHFFQPTAAIGDAAERLLASLAVEAKADPATARRAKRAATPTLVELIAVFHEEYAGGFGDAAWTSKVRGVGARRRAKKHREAAVAHAAELLAKEALDGLLASNDAAAVVERAVTVLKATDLVTKTQLAALASAAPTMGLAKALRDLMYEPDVDGAHFDRLARMLGRSPEGKVSWPLMTALRAVVDPAGDVVVRPSVFRAMAEVVMPSLSRRVRPHGGYYNRYVAMVRDLRDALVERGEAPRDLLDVYDFMWTVCRPAAAKVLVRVRQQAAREAAAETTRNAVATEVSGDPVQAPVMIKAVSGVMVSGELETTTDDSPSAPLGVEGDDSIATEAEAA
ncbi:MAG: hypothetical protein AAF799_23515 [Myxococcota bacterium]